MLSAEDAIKHLLRVSSGLDSLIVGEGQILAQVKKAYEKGIEENGKAETGISKGAVSISSAAVEFSAMTIDRDCGIKSGLSEASISIIGAGKMARLLLVHLESQVPRNVHPDCASIDGVKSYNVDDLKLVVERNTAKRRREMLEAENIVNDELSKYRLWQQSLGAIPTIAKLQEKAESLRIEELQKASKKLSKLSAADLEAVDRLSKGIVAKLLHGPMNHLRQQKEIESTRAAIQQVQQAFQLEQ
eukprot:gene21725-28115_t